jgi:hypothetical protein
MSQTKRTVRQALQHVANYPEPVNDDNLDWPAHELVARTLFDIANRPDHSVPGAPAKANRARKIIMDRLDGKRRAGTRPLRPTGESLLIRDLTGREATRDVE